MSTGRGNFGANMGRPTETNGDFAPYLFESARSIGATVWVIRGVDSGIAVLDECPHSARGRGCFGGFLLPIFTMGNPIGSPTVKCFRFIRKNFTTFLDGKRIVGKIDSWAFRRYIQFQGQSGGLRN